MNKFRTYLGCAAAFLMAMFLLQFIFRHHAIIILGLSFIMLGFQIFIFWKFLRWIDE